MADRSLTAGAQRAIARAEELAREWAHPELLPAHLLWSLLLEESEAFELLTTAGVTQDELKLSDIWHGQYPASFEDEGDGFSKPPVGSPVLSGLENDADDAAAALADAVNSALAGALGCSAGSDASLRESQDWQQVMLAARQLVARRKPAAETSTIHLLLALQAEASPVAALLERFDVGCLASASAEPGSVEAEPLAVAFELNWEADAVDRTATYRILDASANRLREGLRVVEDFVRFVLDDAHLSRLVKNCRHTLRMVLDPLDSLELIASRDTRADVGTSIRTEAEGRRGTPLEVATASLKRAQEAARTLEEYSKLLSADGGPTASDSLPQQLGQLRYELYTLEKAILVTVAADRQLNDRRLYLLLTSELCAGDVEQTLRDAITGGVDIVQLREKALSDRDLLALARRVREITRESGTLFVMNDRPDLAVLCDADGVHVGQEELSVAEVRRVVGPGRLVGVSTHSIEQARQAVLDGASYLGVGPVFPSRTKSFEQFAGLDFVRQVAGEIALPWFPIGGITPANLSQVTGAGAIRAAVCGAVLQARSPAEASSDLAEELRRAASLVRTVSQ
jgi:thiamine-phosphate pyrophosphorylase